MRPSVTLVVLMFTVMGCASAAERQARRHEMPAPKEAPAPPPLQPQAINPSLTAAARKEISAALASNDPMIRSHAIEAAQQTLGTQAKAAYLKALQDPAPPVRFAASMAVGQLQIAEAKPALLQMINDTNQQVGIAVRFALHRLGDKTYSKDLQGSAKDPQWQIRANTALVLGMIDEPTAKRVLLPMAKDSHPAVRLQAAEALWRLGDDTGLKALVSYSASGYPDDQMVALLGLVAPKDRRVLGHVQSALTADYTEVTLVAARAAGMVGSDSGYVIAREGAKSKDARQRSLAALALGAIGRSDAQSTLAQLLGDKDSADVRLCAAKALLQLQSPTANASNQ